MSDRLTIQQLAAGLEALLRRDAVLSAQETEVHRSAEPAANGETVPEFEQLEEEQ